VGKLNEGNMFIPNKYLSELLIREAEKPESINDIERKVIDTVKTIYGENIKPKAVSKGNADKIADILKPENRLILTQNVKMLYKCYKPF
jgi:hypothetical protein